MASTATERLTVEGTPPEFAVEPDTTDESIPVGGTVTVAAETTNERTQSVGSRAGETVSATRGLGLDTRESETVELDHEVTDSDGDKMTHRRDRG